MGRKQIKDGERKNYYLDKNTIKLMSIMAGQMGLSVSAWIDLTVEKIYNSTDLGKKKQLIDREMQDLKVRLSELKEEKKRTEKIEVSEKSFSEIQKEKFIKILTGMVLANRDELEVRVFAKNHSNLLHGKYTAEELLIEAYKIAGR